MVVGTPEFKEANGLVSMVELVKLPMLGRPDTGFPEVVIDNGVVLVVTRPVDTPDVCEG